jgi:hypothetical protein
MKTAIEEELGTAFAARAATVPHDAAARLGTIDYHPRRHRRGVPIGLGTGVAGAATAGTVLAVVLGGAAPAYAGWSAAPTAPAAAAPSSQANQSCLTSLPSNDPAGGQLGSGSWQPVLSDVRGPFTVALFQNAGAYAACFTSSSFTETTQVSADGSSASNAQTASGSVHASGSGGGTAGGMSSVSVGGTSSGDLQNVVQTHLSTTADGPYTLVDGRVASGVSAVTLVRDDGQNVVATVADGWLIAWWPGGATATSSEVTTASGTSTEALQSSTKGPAAPPNGFSPGACAAASGAPNASKASDGHATNVPVRCAGGSGNSGSSGNSGNSGSLGNLGSSGGTSTNSGTGGGASLKSGG